MYNVLILMRTLNDINVNIIDGATWAFSFQVCNIIIAGKLVLKIPWKNLYSEPVVAQIDGLYLLVRPNTGKYWYTVHVS